MEVFRRKGSVNTEDQIADANVRHDVTTTHGRDRESSRITTGNEVVAPKDWEPNIQHNPR